MHNKILRPRTIIPPELYVERAADRQLRSIVNDMGRPGYVLVARQMGKTNLLLNMKRERKQDVVLYMDLSSRSDSSRAWFRRIIDMLLEANEDDFENVSEQIAAYRNRELLEPSVEFDRSIRLLLRKTCKKIVIVLDEIDSLVNTTYSDTVLAQIRSMYFSRINYPEYHRLTYVLSGVAEPADLIKDKNISPFNIGEKIYLEDFSQVEFDDFLGRAGLSLSAAAADRVFYWARGNPRMTWDICSEIEDLITVSRQLDESAIDAVVEKLYLREFDRAPVDHIRTLVESDSQIRDALVAIRYGKSDALSDKVKSRLYLAGISRFGVQGKVEIKNNIIDIALSERWIEQLAGTRRSMLTSASESYKHERYEDAVVKFEQVLAIASSAEELDYVYRMELGLSYLWTGRTTKAVHELKACLSQTLDPTLQQQIQHYLGAALVSVGHYEEGLELLRSALSGPNVSLRRQSRVTSMSAYLQLGPKQYASEALALADLVLAELPTPDSPTDQEVLVSIFYNRAKVHMALEQVQVAMSDLERAQTFASPVLLPATMLFAYQIEKDEISRGKIAASVAHTILKYQLRPTTLRVGTLLFAKEHIALTIAYLQRSGNVELQERMLEYVEASLDEGHCRFDTLVGLFDSLPSEDLRRSGVDIVFRAVDRHLGEVAAVDSRRHAFRALALYASDAASDWHIRYFDELTSSVQPDALDHEDANALMQLGMESLRKRRWPILEGLASVHWRYSEAMLEKFAGEHALLLFLELQYHKISNASALAERPARRILQVIDTFDRIQDDNSISSIIPIMRREAREVLRSLGPAEDPFRHFGRNQRVLVRYGEETPRERKFKYVADDLRAGRCALVKNPE